MSTTTLDDLHQAWTAACEGDSNDAEVDAARDLIEAQAAEITRLREQSTKAESYTFARHPSGTTTLRLSRFDGNADFETVAELALTPDEALEFIATTTRELTIALTDAATSIHRGDCARCGNVRLVVQERSGGRTERVHCPDCRPGEHVGFSPVPQIGGGVR